MQSLSNDEYCAEIVNYTLSVSSGKILTVSGGADLSNCSGTVCVFGPDDDLSMRVNVANTTHYTVTLGVCTEMVCRADITPLSESTGKALVMGVNCAFLSPAGLTCSEPTWGICDEQLKRSCNFPERNTSGWSCTFTTNEARDIAVVDVFPDGRVGGQLRVPSFDPYYNCGKSSRVVQGV